MSNSKVAKVNISSILVIVGAVAFAFSMVRGFGVRSPGPLLIFSLGPLFGVALDRTRGGKGLVGGAAFGVVTGCVFTVGSYLFIQPRVTQNGGYLGLLTATSLMCAAEGLLLAGLICLYDMVMGAFLSKKPASQSL